MSDDWVLESWENESSRSRKSKDEKWEQLSRRRKDVCGWDHKRKKIFCTVTDSISDRYSFFIFYFFFKKRKWHDYNTLTHMAMTFFFLIYFFQKMQVGDNYLDKTTQSLRLSSWHTHTFLDYSSWLFYSKISFDKDDLVSHSWRSFFFFSFLNSDTKMTPFWTW